MIIFQGQLSGTCAHMLSSATTNGWESLARHLAGMRVPPIAPPSKNAINNNGFLILAPPKPLLDAFMTISRHFLRWQVICKLDNYLRGVRNSGEGGSHHRNVTRW